MRAAVLLLVVCLLLTGCASKTDPGGDGPEPTGTDPGGPRTEDPRDAFAPPGHPCVRDDVQPRLYAPDIEGDPWVLGQWWQYDFTLDGVTRPTRLVYFEDQDFDSAGTPQHYMVGTADRADALEKAIYATNPMVGRVHRAMYSPHESGDHADMFNFPLCDGSSWTTRYYGETFTLTARAANVSAGTSSGPGYRIEGASAEGGRLAIEYTPSAQWFTLIDLERGDGQSLQLQLTDRGSGHTGAAHFLRGQDDVVVDLSSDLPVSDTAIGRADGRDGPFDSLGIGIRANLIGPAALNEILLLDPAGEVAASWRIGTLVGADAVDEMVELPFQAGEWSVVVAGLPGTLEGTLQVVSLYDRGSTT